MLTHRVYRHEICTQTIFGIGCDLEDKYPNSSTRVSALLFAQEFFKVDGSRSISLDEFQAYIAWILKETSASSNNTLELLTHDPFENDLTLIRLNSLEEAYAWLQKHLPPKTRKR